MGYRCGEARAIRHLYPPLRSRCLGRDNEISIAPSTAPGSIRLASLSQRRGGKARTFQSSALEREAARKIIHENVSRSCLIDDSAGYQRLCSTSTAQMVSHQDDEWARGDVYTNTADRLSMRLASPRTAKRKRL
jgi:hypothetical protein